MPPTKRMTTQQRPNPGTGYSLLLASLLFLLNATSLWAQEAFITPYEASDSTQTATYEEGMAFYSRLAETYPQIHMADYGHTDSGHSLHLVLLSMDQDFDPESIKRKGKLIYLINNGIHPGEPDGIDASMMFLRDIVQNPAEYEAALEKVVLAIIPFYNIGGVLNRSPYSRPNQNGPIEYGFRGNGRNYDLNRDFIKMDTRNARSFAELFHLLDPDIFVDTHVSNGADFQHVMTTVNAQKDKLGGPLATYLEGDMIPFLNEHMAGAGFDLVPYVNAFGRPPDARGYSQFLDLPRYSTGYTALFHTIGFMSETHMLKSYIQRVSATYAFLDGVLRVMERDGEHIKAHRAATKEAVKTQETFALTWKLDQERYSEILFKGYEASQIESPVTGQLRMYYDRSKPFEKTIPYYNHFVADAVVARPAYYLIPQGWHNVLDRLRLNQIEMTALERDSTFDAEVYYIEDYSARQRPYEGHYFHDQVALRTEHEPIKARKGDMLIPVNQWGNRYIVETLEPLGADSFFRWNFFDTILQQKEGYSSYVFEDFAVRLLAENDSLRVAFEERKRTDEEFSQSGRQQLDFIFENSVYYEPAHLRYPVFRIMK